MLVKISYPKIGAEFNGGYRVFTLYRVPTKWGFERIMSDPKNVAHDKKVTHEKQKQGEDLAKGAAHMPQPGKKTAHKSSHGAHNETEAEEAGGNVMESTESCLTLAAVT